MTHTPYAILLTTLCLSSLLVGCPRLFKPKLEELSHHRIKQITNWSQELKQPVDERIYAAPEAVIDYMDLDNRFNGFDGHPESVPLTPALKSNIAAAIHALPETLQRKLAERLIGVFVVRGLGSSAYTDYVRDEKKRARYAFVVIDIDAMDRKANDWMTWKENSPFLSDASNRVDAILETDANNTRERALEYVLIHEFAHVLAFNSDVHPLWSHSSKKIDLEDYPFTETSWTVDPNGDGYLRRLEQKTPLPGSIIYYKPSNSRPPGNKIAAYYDWLMQSDFVTLYGATNPYDDFAESLVTYVHSVVQKRPWEIRVFQNGKLERTVTACWDEPRCAVKRKVLEEFFE